MNSNIFRLPVNPVPACFALACAALQGCGSGSGGGDSESRENVFLFTSGARLSAASGAAEVNPLELFEAASGLLLVTDAASSSVLAVVDERTVFVLTSKADLSSATGAASVTLGPFDQIRSGVLAGRLLSADAVSGNLLLFEDDGTPGLFSSKAKIIAVTGEADASMSLPRELTANQIVAQDLQSFAILRFDTFGNPTPFVGSAALAAAAGTAQPAVAGWARGPATQSLYARFGGTANIVRLQVNGQVSRYVSAAALAGLFPDVNDLRVLEIAADTDTDILILLIGEGLRGVAVALVDENGSASVFASRESLRKAAGNGVDIADLIVILDGILVAVDRGGAQVLTFGDGGKPIIVGRGADIREASGALAPVLPLGTGLSTGEAVVFESESDSLILVR